MYMQNPTGAAEPAVLQGGGERGGGSGGGGGSECARGDAGSEPDAGAGGKGAAADELPSETGAGGDGPDGGGGNGEKVSNFDSAMESLNQVAALLLDHKGREADLRQQINRNAQELQQTAANHDKQVLALRKALEVSESFHPLPPAAMS